MDYQETQFFMLEYEEITVKPKLAFVILPFKNILIFEKVLKPIFEEYGYEILKADDMFSTTIMQGVANLIKQAGIIVADLTNRNPNVFYELGLAHALNKKVLLITQNGDDVPTDLKAHRYYKYEFSNSDGILNFENYLRKFLDDFKKPFISDEETHDITAYKGNELRIPCDFLGRNEGTFSIWAYINDDHYNTKNRDNQYILSHSGNKGRMKKIEYEDEDGHPQFQKIYINACHIGKFYNKETGKIYWRFGSSDGIRRDAISTDKKIDIGWHLFTVMWSKNYDFVKFYIDDKYIGSYNSFLWPEKIEKFAFIGRWPGRSPGHYFNSKVGGYYIYDYILEYGDIRKLYSDTGKDKK